MIRPFTLEDLPTMVELGKIMHEESVYRDLDFDAQKLIDLGHHYIANPERCWSAVAEVNGRIIGMYAGYITEYYFGKDLIAQDLLLFVDPYFYFQMLELLVLHDLELLIEREHLHLEVQSCLFWI